MNKPIRMAVVGVGRIGVFHARHVQELARETGVCELVAVSDTYGDTASRVAAELQADQATEIHAFNDVSDLVASDLIDAALVASRTEDHERDARVLVDAGCRVLLEKPLTHSLASAEAFVADLNRDPRRKNALMLAFMRRFDAPLLRTLFHRQMVIIARACLPIWLFTIAMRFSGCSAVPCPNMWPRLGPIFTIVLSVLLKRITTMLFYRCGFPVA